MEDFMEPPLNYGAVNAESACTSHETSPKVRRNLAPPSPRVSYVCSMRWILQLVLSGLRGHLLPAGGRPSRPRRSASRVTTPWPISRCNAPRPARTRFEYQWDEHVWRFASAAHRDLFKADPVRYAPQFANFCAVALARGEVREANPEYWLISDGKLYLFGKSIGPEIFRKELAGSIERAEHNRGLLPKTQPPAGK